MSRTKFMGIFLVILLSLIHIFGMAAMLLVTEHAIHTRRAAAGD